MSDVKKMVLVDPLSIPVAPSRDRPPIDALLDILDREMRDVLKTSVSAREKVRRFEEIFARYTRYRRKRSPRVSSRVAPPTTTRDAGIGGDEFDAADDLVNAAIPATYAKAGRRVLRKILAADKYGWDAHGRFKRTGGAPFEDSSIARLLRYAVDRTGPDKAPEHYRDFFRAMLDSGVSSGLIGSKEKRKEYENQEQWGSGKRSRRRSPPFVGRWARLRM